jgi:phospholipid/cholesterol/gamma-HCH transport system substrate-binding protein
VITKSRMKIGLAVVLSIALVVGIGLLATSAIGKFGRTQVTAYFDNSNGIFAGDDVFLLGVKIGEIDSVSPEPTRAKITFWYEDKYPVPADAMAVILSPQLITSRAIALTPKYTGGPRLGDDAVIPQDRTAVPVEWDDFRQQLEKLSSSLQPGPDGISPLGAFVNTAADNLRGQGVDIRDTLIKVSQVFATFGDHSNDLFTSFKNLSILVQALQSSTQLMAELNQNLAAVTSLLADRPDDIGRAIDGLNSAATEVKTFVADNRESLGTASDKLSSITTAMNESLEDIKQTLHVAPTAFANFINIYEPSHAALTGALAVNNFANPITFLCGAIQAASRLGSEQAAKLCVQYLAPIIKNRQYNFPPIGVNPFVGAPIRPNEITYSEDWMRPDNRPMPPAAPALPEAGANTAAPPLSGGPLPAEAPVPQSVDPAAGLQGMMLPPQGIP